LQLIANLLKQYAKKAVHVAAFYTNQIILEARTVYQQSFVQPMKSALVFVVMIVGAERPHLQSAILEDAGILAL